MLNIGPAILLGLATVLVTLRKRSPVAPAVLAALAAGAVSALLYPLVLHKGPLVVELDGFALIFAAPLAGLSVRLLWDRLSRRAVLPMLAGLLAVLSFAGATFTANFNWKSQSVFVAEMSKLMKPGENYLVAQAVVPEYYLSGHALPRQFVSTLAFAYRDPGTHAELEGRAAFQSAIDAGYFSLIALPAGGNFGSLSGFLRATIGRSDVYALADHLPVSATQGGWDIWISRSAELSLDAPEAARR
jgi:hypothetical protein